tara:strand:- start:94 stop:525 length:432 start_codon:yes stop_codon:yes gene_type:complete
MVEPGIVNNIMAGVNDPDEDIIDPEGSVFTIGRYSSATPHEGLITRTNRTAMDIEFNDGSYTLNREGNYYKGKVKTRHGDPIDLFIGLRGRGTGDKYGMNPFEDEDYYEDQKFYGFLTPYGNLGSQNEYMGYIKNFLNPLDGI